VSGQFHALAAFHSGKEPLIPIGWMVGWVSKPVWTWWQREKFLHCFCSKSNHGYL